MSRKDSFGNTCNKMVRIHFRQLQPIAFDLFQALSDAQRVYGKYGILVQSASFEAIRLKRQDMARLHSVETECFEDESSPEQTELYERFGVQDLSSITAFLVGTLPAPAHPPLRQDTPALGCAGHSPHRPAIFIGAFPSPLTLAHEVGHILLEQAPGTLRDHANDPFNVMHPYQALSAKNPRFSITQLEWMHRSQMLLPC